MLRSLLIIFLFVSLSCEREKIKVYDGFETPVLSSSWDQKKLLPGSFEIQSKIVRSGSGAIKVLLRKGDQLEEEKGTVLERAELLESRSYYSYEDIDYAYSFSLFIPQDFPIVSTRLVIAQWKQRCNQEKCQDNSPTIGVRYQSGKLRITLQTDSTKTNLYETTQEIRNKWLDFKFKIRFSRQNGGSIETHLNKQLIINYKGKTCYDANFGFPDKSYFYFKMGLYRDTMDEPMIIYIDEYKKEEL